MKTGNILFVECRLICGSVKKFIGKIHEIEFFRCPGDGSIHPAQIFDIQHIFLEKTRVDENRFPLPSLGFMTGDSIGEFYLKGIEPLILNYFFSLFFPVVSSPDNLPLPY